jgi:hypothetical protein
MARKPEAKTQHVDGVELTDEAADRIVGEVDRAIDEGRGEWSFPRKGRPSLTGRSLPSPHVGFRVTPELRALAEREAAARGTTVSALARRALEDFLGRAG